MVVVIVMVIVMALSVIAGGSFRRRYRCNIYGNSYRNHGFDRIVMAVIVVVTVVVVWCLFLWVAVFCTVLL